MKQIFNVVCGAYSFSFSEEDLQKIKNPSNDTYFLASQKIDARIESRSNSKSGTVWVEGWEGDFEIRTAIDLLIEKMGMNLHSTSVADQLQSPMPGLVLKILVQAGDQLKKGDPILILEAMKMENILMADADVTVAEICTKEGDAVEKNQVLVRFEV